MNTSIRIRIVRLTGLVLLSMLVVVLAVPAAQTMRAYSLSVQSTSAEDGTMNAVQGPTPADVAPAGSSGLSSTTVFWIAAAAVVGALVIGSSWALARRHRRRSAAPICEVEPAGC